jgi:hypothetical protein
MPKKYVIKSNGEEELFSSEKAYESARRVGASEQLAKEISGIIEKEAFPGIKTSEIFRQVKQMLKQETPGAALKFNLKKAIRKLGPTGFPFEKYIGEILSSQGYQIKLNQVIPGLCCEYEIDFIAQKDSFAYIGECKYRNLFDGKVHTKDALANYARFLDINKGNFFKNNKLKSLLVTNTKFTSRAVNYSQCAGVELLGWRYPGNRGLEYLIESQKLYPITVLPSLNKYLAEVFSANGIMLARDLLDKNRIVKLTNFPEKKLNLLFKQAQLLLRNN